MGNARHSRQTTADGIHGIIAYLYANEAARLAATGFTAEDKFKVCIELDSSAMYVLINHSPITWEAVGNDAIETQLNKVEIPIRKNTAGTLSVGDALYQVGCDFSAGYAFCEKAQATGAMPCVGICSVEATDTTTGKVMLLGVIHEVDTSALTAYTPMYVSHTVAGGLVTAPPPGPYVTQCLGTCMKTHATEGCLGVNTLGYRAYDYTNIPEDLGTAAHGLRNLASPSDHVHAMPKLDDLVEPDDNTDLDVSTARHGLMPKLPDDSTKFFNGAGSWVERPTSSVVLGVRNETAAAMSKGDVVYVSGWSSGHSCSLIGLADKNDAAKRPALGLLQSDLAVNANGYVLVSGKLTGFNTSTPGWAITDQLVLGANGALSRPPPDQSPFVGEVQNVAIVTRVDGVDGELLVMTDGMIPVPAEQLFVLNTSELAKTADPTVNDDANDGYVVGSRWINTTDDREFVCVDSTVGSAVWTRTSGRFFGDDLSQGSSDGESSTTSGTYQQKLRVTTGSLPSGTYRIGWACEWNKSSLTDIAVRIQVNDTTTISEPRQEAGDAGSDQWNPFSGFGYYTGSGVLNIDLDFHAAGTGTATVRRARLEIWRVS